MNIQNLKTKTNHLIQQCAVYLEMLSHKPYSENFEIERVFLLSRAYAMQMAQKLEHFSEDTNVQPILENIKTLLETFDNVKNGTPMNRILLTNFKTELFTWSKSIAFAMQVDHLVSQKEYVPSSTEFQPNEETTNIHIETPGNVPSFASTQAPPQSMSGSNFGTSKSPSVVSSFFERSSTPSRSSMFGSNSGTSSSSSGSNSGTSSSSSSASNSGTSSSAAFGSFASSTSASTTFGSNSGTSSSSSATFGSSSTLSSSSASNSGTSSATSGSSFDTPSASGVQNMPTSSNVFSSTSLKSSSDILTNEMPPLEPMEESPEYTTAKKELDCFVENQPASLITIENFFLPFHICFRGEFYRSKTSNNSALESHPITATIHQDYLELLSNTKKLQENPQDQKYFISKWTNLKKQFNFIGKNMQEFETLSSFIPQLKTETCEFTYDASRMSMQQFLTYVTTCTLCQDDTCIQNLKAQYKKEANDYNAKTEEEVTNFYSSLGLAKYKTISNEISENAKKQHETTELDQLKNLQTQRAKLLESLQSESLKLQRESVSWDESLVKDALYATIFTDEQRLCTWNFWNENYQFDPNLLKACLHSVTEECKDSKCKKTKVYELLTRYHQKALAPKENELLQKIQSLKQKIADEQKQNKVDDLQRTFQNLTVHRARLQVNELKNIPEKSDHCVFFQDSKKCDEAKGLSSDIYTAMAYLYKPKDELFDKFTSIKTQISRLEDNDARTVDLVQRYFELYHEINQFKVAQTLVNFNVRGMISALDTVRKNSSESHALVEELANYPPKENFTLTDLYEFWYQKNPDARFYDAQLKSKELWNKFQESLSRVKNLQSNYESQYKQIFALVEAINSDASEQNPGVRISDNTKKSLTDHFTALLTLNTLHPLTENVENLKNLRDQVKTNIQLQPKEDCKAYSILGNQGSSVNLEALCALKVDKSKIIEYIKYLETHPRADKDFANYTDMFTFYQKNLEKLKQIAQDWNNPNHVDDIRESLKSFFQIAPNYETGGFYDDFMKYYNALNYYYHLNNFQIIEKYKKRFPETNPFDACDLETSLPIVMSHETNDARQMMALENCNEALDDAKFKTLIVGRKTEMSNEIIGSMNTRNDDATIYFAENAKLIDGLKDEFEFCSKLLEDEDFKKIYDLSKWMHEMEQAEFKGDTCNALREAIVPNKRLQKLWAADTVNDIHKTIGIQMGKIQDEKCFLSSSTPGKRPRGAPPARPQNKSIKK